MYQDVRQQPFLLTVAYARGLQYWAEELNPPESPDSCPLAGSVGAKGDSAGTCHIHQLGYSPGPEGGLLGATNQWLQAMLFS